MFGNCFSALIKKLKTTDLRNTGKFMVAEPELVKNIMIKDFHLFVNHNTLGSIDEIADHSLLSAEDEEWKRLRSIVKLIYYTNSLQIVSPTFSTGKIRKMYALVEHCVKGVDKMLEKAANGEQEIDVRSLMGNYTMDGIASCAFATKTDTHNDPNNPFIINARKLFSQNMWRSFGYLTMKPVMKFFNISILEPTTTEFFKRAITEIVSQRKKDKSGGHHDFLQLMINAQKNVDNLEDIDDKLMAAEAHHGMDDNRKLLTNKSKLEVSDLDILANSLLFFLAGFETTGHLLSHMSYLLAINPECQKKLMEEVVANTDANGNLDYDTIIRLPYLDACVSESLRLHSPAPGTTRVGSEDYKLGDTGITIKKGIEIFIPIHAIHHNPEYYPKPHDFIPDRFLPENRDKLTPYTYLPFGA
ncbi:unnamed protein product, partial [Medioppia subpectinata]